MKSKTYQNVVEVGPWHFDAEAASLAQGGERVRLEPKVADLLAFLVERASQVVSKDDLTHHLWPDVIVGEDALPRCVSKLRRALGDDPKSPRFIETVPKRGYRLLAPVVAQVDTELARGGETEVVEVPPARDRFQLEKRLPVLGALVVLIVGGLYLAGRQADPGPFFLDGSPSDHSGRSQQWVERADDLYAQINRRGNEAAIALYERALTESPDLGPAHAGLANALVQRVMRYSADAAPDIAPVNLGSALASGRLETDEARHQLQRALGLAERSVRLAPRNAASHKALGFVQSALGDFESAEASYQRAVQLDPQAWDVLINLGDIDEIQGRGEEALVHFEAAYEAMVGLYASRGQRVGPWIAEMGVAIGDRHEVAGRGEDAEVWYRRVLGFEPLHPTATCALARRLERSGDGAAAGRLRDELAQRLDEQGGCSAFLRDLKSP